MFEVPPKSVCLAPPKSAISRRKHDSLITYIDFLSAYGKVQEYEPARKELIECVKGKMAAIFDASNPASPLAYPASQTALLLMDFQGMTVARGGDTAREALAKAKVMRDWALSRDIMVLHSVVDVQGRPPATCKGFERINKLLEAAAADPSASEEPEEIAFSQRNHEYIALKHPGHNSALKSKGAMEILREHGIQSLLLCGLSTSGCVLRTTMPAADDGFVVSVIEDACMDPVPGLHDTLMKNVIPARAHVATAENFVKRWDGMNDG
jgi:nicotinamidase-related amidase